MKTPKSILLLLLFISLCIISCTNDTVENEIENELENENLVEKSQKKSSLFNFVSKINVTVTKIQGRNTGNKGSKFVTLVEKETKINLLELNNGLNKIFKDEDIPSGSYNLLRVKIKKGKVLLKNGKTYRLKVPSRNKSGLKIFIEPSVEVVDGSMEELSLNYDISKSLVFKRFRSRRKCRPGNTGFILKPVIKAMHQPTTSPQSYSLSGNVTGYSLDSDSYVPLEGAQVLILTADNIALTTTFTDANGNYEVKELNPGSYNIQTSASGYNNEFAEGVVILADKDTIQDFQLELELGE